MTRIVIADVESTGFTHNQIIEEAIIDIDYETLESVKTHVERFCPSFPIELGAMATHHIMEEELQYCSLSDSCKFPEDIAYVIGHNTDYDWKAYGEPDVRRICTLALSRWLYPDIDSHSQSAMLYFFMGTKARPLLKEAHSALCDVENNLRLFKYLMTRITYDLGYKPGIEELYTLSEFARVPTKVSFGKFKGQPYTAMNQGYVFWWMNKSDTKPDQYQLQALRNAGFKV